jgi:hypothetical protein
VTPVVRIEGEEFPPEVATGYRNIVLRDHEGNEFYLSAGTFRTWCSPARSAPAPPCPVLATGAGRRAAGG